MKKALSGILALMLLALSACTAATSVNADKQSTGAGTASMGKLNTNYDDAVSIVTQLAVGTLNLDGTENAVTKDEADKLLPLWEEMESLAPQGMHRLERQSGTPEANGENLPDFQGTPNPSMQPGLEDVTQSVPEGGTGTPSAPHGDSQYQAKMEALVTKIEAAMTSAQINAIVAMQITRESAATILAVKGIKVDEGPGSFPTNVQKADNTQQTTAQSSEGTVQATPRAGGSPGGQMARIIQPGIMNSVIQYLAGVAGVAAPTVPAPFVFSGTSTPTAEGTDETGSIPIVTSQP